MSELRWGFRLESDTEHLSNRKSNTATATSTVTKDAAATTSTSAACTLHQDAFTHDLWTPCGAEDIPYSFDFAPNLRPDSAGETVASSTVSLTFLDWTTINDELLELMPTIDPETNAPDLTLDLMPLLLPQWPDQTNDPSRNEVSSESRYMKATETLLSPPRFPPSPEGLDSANEFMLLYCESFMKVELIQGLWLGVCMKTDGSLQLVSRHIAPEMMILDGPHNGWRYLILPMARTDSLVRDAILAVSCFHLCLSSINSRCPSAEDAVSQWQFPGPGLNPRHLYARAIKGLHSRQLMSYDGASQLPILVTIMVLLTSSMVTGDQDFPILFRMLQSAFDALGGEQGLGQCDLAAFLVRQIHKYVLLPPSAPFGAVYGVTNFVY